MATLTNGLNLDTVNGLGGIRDIWILGGTVTTYGPYVSPPTYNNPSQGATGLTAIGGTGTWYHFSVARDMTNYTETITPSQDNGTLFYAGKLTTQFQHMDATKNQTLMQLAQNRYLKIIYRDSNNKDWAVGFDRGAYMVASPATTGTKPGDANDYKVTFQTESINPVYPLTAGIETICTAGGFTVQPINNC